MPQADLEFSRSLLSLFINDEYVRDQNMKQTDPTGDLKHDGPRRHCVHDDALIGITVLM